MYLELLRRVYAAVMRYIKNKLHMPNDDELALPFITREMLDGGNSRSIQLVIRHTSTVSCTFDISGLTRQGLIVQRITTAVDDLLTKTTVGLADFPIFLSGRISSGIVTKGELYVQVQVEVDGQQIATLFTGYITDLSNLSWPYLQTQNNFPDQFPIFRELGTDQAAGSELSDTVPDNQYWEVQAVRVRLVTDSNTANRRPHFIFRDQTNGIVAEVFSDQDQAASTSRDYTLMPIGVLPASIDDNDIIIPIPSGLLLEPGSDILTDTTNFQVGDNWTQPTYQVRRWVGRAGS